MPHRGSAPRFAFKILTPILKQAKGHKDARSRLVWAVYIVDFLSRGIPAENCYSSIGLISAGRLPADRCAGLSKGHVVIIPSQPSLDTAARRYTLVINSRSRMSRKVLRSVPPEKVTRDSKWSKKFAERPHRRGIFTAKI